MNIEIANRLVNLRKSNGLSQEALAEKLGISRQAVSKWERAEASPDTDNIIMLARLYGISLDELLRTEDEIPLPEPEEDVENGKEGRNKEVNDGRTVVPDGERIESAGTSGDKNLINEQEMRERKEEEESGYGEHENYGGSRDTEYVHVGFEGVHVKDKDGSEVHVGWDGIHVDDRKRGDEVHIDGNGVYVNGERYDREWLVMHGHLPFTAVISLLYLIMGFVFGAWHPAWLLFLLIPIWHSFLEAVRRDNANVFAYPVLATLLFLCAGIFRGAWHPGWVIFLTIPIYYPVVSYLAGKDGEE